MPTAAGLSQPQLSGWKAAMAAKKQEAERQRLRRAEAKPPLKLPCACSSFSVFQLAESVLTVEVARIRRAEEEELRRRVEEATASVTISQDPPFVTTDRRLCAYADIQFLDV